MKNKVCCAVLALMLMVCISFSAVCAEDTVRVTALKGPTAMGLVQMMENRGDEYTFSVEGSIDAITPKLVKNETDIAAVPANLAAVLYQKTEGALQVVAVNTLGVLYIVENGETVQNFADLRGRTIYASGKGATPEYALNYLLRENGIDPEKDVTIEWKSEHSECLAALLNDKGAVALLPQPFVTTAQLSESTVRIAIDLNEAWKDVQESAEKPSQLITGVMVVRKEFAENYPDKVNDFLDCYAESVAFVNQDNESAAALIGKFDIIPEAVALKALPYCSIVCIEGDEMKDALSGYLQVLYEQNPAAVGGMLPEEDFYYAR